MTSKTNKPQPIIVRLYENPHEPGEWIIDKLIPKWEGLPMRPYGCEYEKKIQFTNLKINAYQSLKEFS